ncbi:tyrosine-protein kinase receptor Tie-1-like [Saccoglossus kowalevskii]
MIEEFINYGMQIANGMDFLDKEEIVLRTLTSRSIYIGYNKECKVTDLGLSTAVMSLAEFELVTRGRLPVRWMALESLLDCFYTTKSDTWSFGIVLWEIFSFGCVPYAGLSPNELTHQLQSGYRIPKPLHCDKHM